MRGLLAEDDDLAGQVLVEALGDEGHQVALARSLSELQQLLPAQRWAAIITDGFSQGYRSAEPADLEMLRYLRQVAPVILVSGREWARHGSPDALGVFAICPKPYDLDDLLQTLERAVSGRDQCGPQ